MLKKSLIDQEILVDKKLDYKSDRYLSLSVLKSKKAEIVNKTPFDDFETSVALKAIDQRITELYDLITVNHKTVDGITELADEIVDELSEQISEEIKALNRKIDLLLPKAKKERQVELLRAPLNKNLYIPAMPIEQQRAIAAQQARHVNGSIKVPAGPPTFWSPKKPITDMQKFRSTMIFLVSTAGVCSQAGLNPIAQVMCASGLALGSLAISKPTFMALFR